MIKDDLNILIKDLENSCSLNTDDISDGAHTFGELYYHRAVLFSLFINNHQDVAWKSYKHANGDIWEGYFIVGVTTPEGDYSYHYQNDMWDLFHCKEVEHAPVYDGHKPSDIDRLFSL